MQTYNLNRFSTSVYNQGSINDCMQNALANTVQIMAKQAGMGNFDMARLQNYWDTRLAQNTTNTDGGSVPQVALEQARLKGMANESLWGHHTGNLYQQPTEAVYQDASLHKITGWYEIPPNQTWDGIAESIRGMLKEGKPVILCFKIGSAYFGQQGTLDSQTNRWAWSENGPGHAATVEDMLDTVNGGSYLTENSWSQSWGFGGYGTIGYTQFVPQSEDFIGAFALNGINGVDFTYTIHRKMAAQLYSGIFDRAPEAAGIDFWAGHLKNGLNLTDAANSMFGSAEARIYFPQGSTSAQLVDAIYVNVLGRHADPSGLATWSQQIEQHSFGHVFATITDYIANYNGADTGTRLEHDRFMNRIDVSMYYGVASQADGNHYAAAVECLDNVTYDQATAELAKIGITQDLGYL